MTDITRSWAELGAELFDLLTGRRAEISYHFDNMEVSVPSHAAPTESMPNHFALWKINGVLRISSRTINEQ